MFNFQCLMFNVFQAPLVLNLISPKTIRQHNEFAEEGNDPSVLPAVQDICADTLQEGKYSSAKDTHHEHAGSLGGIFAESPNGQREDTAPHHGMHQSDGTQEPQVLCLDGCQDEQRSNDGCGNQHLDRKSVV